MNPGKTPDSTLLPGSQGKDDDAIWGQVPRALQSSIAQVDKRYYDNAMNLLPQAAHVVTAQDKLFLTSYSEIMAGSYYAGWAALSNEGTCYAWWQQHATQGDRVNSTLRKSPVSLGGEVSASSWMWWQRSVTPDYQHCICYVNGSGQVYQGYGFVTSGLLGVCPAFCL